MLQRIRRAPNTLSTPVQHMRIDHRRPDIAVTQQLLHRPNIIPILQQMRRERVPECMARGVLLDISLPDRGLHCLLQNGLIHVMPSLLTCLPVHPTVLLWEHELPKPLGRSVGVLPRQRIGKTYPTVPFREITLVDMPTSSPQPHVNVLTGNSGSSPSSTRMMSAATMDIAIRDSWL